MLVNCGDQAVADPANPWPDGCATRDRKQEIAGRSAKAEGPLYGMGQGDHYREGVAII
jgi:hypothetical protein